ncbi:hypothetical protein [Streptomyces sp. NPDC053367]|uniref:hypothetical protein n=1 Tax=Streptomyces sp. NPDC053367 TaxID=3365700 RepID=UPI0037CE7535
MTQRRIVTGLFISADGVVGAPEQWTFQHTTEEAGALIGALVAEADTMLLGRTTYEVPCPRLPATSAHLCDP